MILIRRAAWILIALTLGLPASLVRGQDRPGMETETAFAHESPCGSLVKGAKIRLRLSADADVDRMGWQPADRTATGTVVTCTGGVLGFKPPGEASEVLEVPLASVESLEVSRGRSSHAVGGAIIGLLAGIAITAATQTRNHEDEFLGGFQDMEENLQRGVMITLLTTVVGGAIGASSGSENWEPIGNGETTISVGRDDEGRFSLAVGGTF